jgi:hypothetical protein
MLSIWDEIVIFLEVYGPPIVIALLFVAGCALWATGIYVVAHFITKYW